MVNAVVTVPLQENRLANRRDCERGTLKTADLAIAGWGFLPAILALQLRALQPYLRILLVSGDAEIPGLALELIMPDRLPTMFADVVAPCEVAQWSSLLMLRGGSIDTVRERTVLLDPLQLRMELMEQFAPDELVAGRSELDWHGGILTWQGARARVGNFIDLRPLTGPAGSTDIVEASDLAGLEFPALSDFPLADDGDRLEPGRHDRELCLRHVPIGEGRVAVSRLTQDTAGWLPKDISGLPGPDFYDVLGWVASEFA